MKTPLEILTELTLSLSKEEDIKILAEFQKDERNESIKSFVNWHNENYPDSYIPNSRIGRFNLQLSIKAAKPNMDKIKDVDKFIDEVKNC